MGWINSLYETYNYLDKHNEPGLPKIAHSTQNAHLEVTLNSSSEIIDVQFVPKEESVTTIPVTEGSANRTSGASPHPLMDKLEYLAKDYEKYCDKDNSKHHEQYMKELDQWCNSKFGSTKVKVVYDYLEKGTLIEDLVGRSIFAVNRNSGKLLEKWENSGEKMSVGNQCDAFVRFRVAGFDDVTALWQDESIQNNYIEYYLKNKQEKAMCHVLGEESAISQNHPSKIRHTGDKAKLISSNDNSNYTYRGRFENAEQAFTIGYEVSQKAHNALKHLIGKQGMRVGEKVFLLWGIQNEETPDPLSGSLGLANFGEEATETNEEVAKRLNQAIMGYRSAIKSNSILTLLGLDAATTGRMAVVFQREYFGQQGNELLDNIEEWHSTCRWNTSYYNEAEKKRVYYFGTPSLPTLVKCALGTERGGFIECEGKLLANSVERLLASVCDGKKIPRDIVRAAIEKAKKPQNYKHEGNWKQVLSIACALYAKQKYDYEGEVIPMNVNKDSKDISYNCGRLLAVADAIERQALFDKNEPKKEIRTTNALRLFTRFTQNPYDTWMVINKKLSVYREKLGDRGSALYDLLGEISQRIEIEDLRKANNLGGAFCLGYDSQRYEIIEERRRKKAEREANKEEK